MNLRNMIAESLIRSTSNVFSTMLGTQLPTGEVTIEGTAEGATSEPNDGVVSFIGIAGSWAGTGSVSCSAAMACRVCAAMLMTEAPSVNEDVLDAVAEITNMIIGSVKTDLEAELGPLGLSLPTVVFGRNFKTRNAAAAEWIYVHFFWDGEPLRIKMCLAPCEKTQAVHHSAAHTYALDV